MFRIFVNGLDPASWGVKDPEGIRESGDTKTGRGVRESRRGASGVRVRQV